jgi:hypothetical protein
VWSGKETESARLKYWEIIADNLKTAGWSLGWVSALDLEGRTSWIADAHRDAKRFIVHADEKLTALLELESQLSIQSNCRDWAYGFQHDLQALR